MKLQLFWLPAAVVLLMAGCATRHSTIARGPGADSPQHILESQTAHKPAATVFTTAVPPESLAVDVLNIANALGLALQYNPELAGFAAEIRARDAAALQAGLPANPEIEVEVENFAGKDVVKGFNSAEMTLMLSQLIELGNKRGKRRQVAMLEKDLSEWDYESKKRDVLAAATRAFIEVLVAQEQILLNNELLQLAQKSAAAVGERVDAGKVSPIEKSRAQVELAAARSEAKKASHKLEATRQRLAGCWGAERAGFTRVVGDLSNIAAPPSEETLKNLLQNNPDLARRGSEIARSRAALLLARSEAVPNLTVSAGIRNSQERNNNTFVAGISMPLPFLNRNQGSIGEARANLEKAQQEQQAARAALQTGLSETWQHLSAAYIESFTLREEILPGAQAAYESTKLGYREGSLNYLQLLDAQRTLFTVKRQYLLALGAYHTMNTELERMINASLKTLSKSAITPNNLRSIQE